MLRRRRRTAITIVATLSLSVTPAVAGSIAHADPTPMVSSIFPAGFGNPTVTPIHVIGTGLSADDTLLDPQGGSHVVFSSVTSDGNGGLNAIVSVTGGQFGEHTLEVLSGTSVVATCSKCMVMNAAPLLPDVYSEEPHDQSLDLNWSQGDTIPGPYVVTWTPPGGPTSDELVPASGTSTNSTTITGLTNATPYTITVAEEDVAGSSVGQAAEFTEQVGVAPDAPILTGSSPCCDMDAVNATDNTWEFDGAANYTFTFTPRDGGGKPTVDPNSGSYQQYQDFDPAGVVVTATATNTVGTSLPSEPIIVKPIVSSSAVLDQHYRFAHRRLTVSWQPPANTGNSPIRHYRVTLQYGHKKHVFTTTALRYRVRLKAGTAFAAYVQPDTTAGLGGESDTYGTGYLDVVTALNKNGSARWRDDDQGGWHALGGHFAQAPQPFMRRGHILTFVGADRSGHAMVRTRKRGWRSLSPTVCLKPTATWDALGVNFACRAENGTLEVAGIRGMRNGLPYVASSDWVSTNRRIVGGPQLAGGGDYSGLVVVRTAPWDSAGDDLRSFDLLNLGETPLHFGKIHLACTGPAAFSGLRNGAVGCPTSSQTVAWRSMSGGGHGTVTTAFRMVGRIAIMNSAVGSDNRVAVTDSSGRIHIIDLDEHLDWTLGTAPTTGLAGVCAKGCRWPRSGP